MALSENVGRVAAYVDKDLIKKMDAICKAANVSKSQLLAAFIQDGLEEFRVLGYLGVPHTRYKAVGKAIGNIVPMSSNCYQLMEIISEKVKQEKEG